MKNLQARVDRIESAVLGPEKHLLFGIKYFPNDAEYKEEKKRLLAEHFKKYPEDEKATMVIFLSDISCSDEESQGFISSYTPISKKS